MIRQTKAGDSYSWEPLFKCFKGTVGLAHAPFQPKQVRWYLGTVCYTAS